MATQNNTWQDWILYWGAWRGGGEGGRSVKKNTIGWTHKIGIQMTDYILFIDNIFLDII